MKSLYFINRFFYPDLSATSQLLTDLSTSLAQQFDVSVVTSRGMYNDPLAKLAQRDEHKGVKVIRLNTTRRGRTTTFGRLLDYTSFYLGVVWFLLWHTRKHDIVVLKTDPPLLSLLNTAVVRLRGGKVVNWLQDIFPEIAIELGAIPRFPLLIRMLTSWRNRTLRAALVNVVISERMKAFLEEQGISNIAVIPNWTDGERISPLEHDDNPLRKEWNPGGKFLVGYSGNFGRAHSFDELIEAMTLLAPRVDIRFVLIGQGAGLEKVLDAVKRNHLDNVSFYPYQPYSNLRQSLGAIDLHIVSLKEHMEGLVFPSKICGILAAGRPVAFVGDGNGEIASLIRKNRIGFVISRARGADLAKQIVDMAKKPEIQAQACANSRRLYESHYSRYDSIETWEMVLQEVPDK